MRLKLTLRRADGSESDIVVTADATATVTDVARAIAQSDPQASPFDAAAAAHSDVTLTVSAASFSHLETLPGDKPIGDAAVGSGYVATMTPAPGRLPQAVAASRSASATTKARPRAAVLRVHSGPNAGQEFALLAGDSYIGRDASCEVCLDDRLVSKRHARITVGETVEFTDLNSANGLVVDGGIVSRVVLAPWQ